MESDFFELYERQDSLNIQIGHNQVADWCLDVFDRKGDAIGQRGEPVVSVSGCDRTKVFAEAYVKLTDYLSDVYGGY